MKVLFAIPHFYDPDGAGRHGSLAADPAPRVRALADALAAIRQLFGRPQCVIDIARRTTMPANRDLAIAADAVVCTTGSHHLLDRLPLGPGYYVTAPAFPSRACSATSATPRCASVWPTATTTTATWKTIC